MTTQETAGQSGEAAGDALGPEAGHFASLDTAGLGQSARAVLLRAAVKPGDVAMAGLRFWSDLARIGPVAAARWLGAEAAPPVPVPADKRFADRSWSDNPAFFALRQAYQAAARLTGDVLAAGAGDPVADAKAELAAGFVLDALAPTNFLLTNPAALKRALDTGGASLAAGARNFLDDLLRNNGRPRQVDVSSFAVGRNLAVTPGRVVFRNELMELIQYAPQTPKVRSVPLLASPPWINKYYVMDLAPGRSFIEWAVQHERTVFAISYRNPDASMRGVTLDDYLVHGPCAALDAIADITRAPKIDIVGLCLGGALTGMLAAYLTALGDDRLGTITLLNTMLDYTEPGVLGTFTDEATIARLEREMAKKGYLEGGQMAGTFDLLRANDLIFSYVVSGWLMGEAPPAFDLLAWNADSTRMPAAMHSFYLRSLYMKNELATGRLELAGQRLSLGQVKNDSYVVGAVNDHIVPWASSYQATSLLGGAVRYILSSGGHIAGIVNPPGPRAWYEAPGGDPAGSDPAAGDPANRDPAGGDPEGGSPADAGAWRAAAVRQAGSWWEDWTRWADQRAGDKVKPPRLGNRHYPAAAPAPGRYVLG
ncbi:MAG TPA: alpha/beta fold hydrolase [Streptosporangiaceae bacterium]|jgi:polyhydroxyalkanoate synthase